MPVSTLLVLAGGLGSRLKSVVHDRPKALAEVAGAPMLEHQLICWGNQGIKNVILMAGIMGDQLEAFVNQEFDQFTKALDMNITVVREATPLGTGGAVHNALSKLKIDGRFIVINADTWLSSGMREMSSLECNAIGVIEMSFPDRYGTVELEGSRVSAFKEKIVGLNRGLINAGIYSLHASVFQKFKTGTVFSLERDILPSLALAGELQAVNLKTDFFDIGVPEDYKRFQEWFVINLKK